MHVTNPTYLAALCEIEQQILRRADQLADQAEQKCEPWFKALQQLTRDLSPEEARSRLRQVAAHRERYGVQDTDILGSNLTRDLGRLNSTERLTNLIARPGAKAAPVSTPLDRVPQRP